MFHHHDTATSAGAPAEHLAQGHTSALADSSVPMRADCCPGRPIFKVVMPPTKARPRPADLWLCGHHYRVCQAALKSAGAHVQPLAGSTDYAVGAGLPAGVAH